MINKIILFFQQLKVELVKLKLLHFVQWNSETKLKKASIFLSDFPINTVKTKRAIKSQAQTYR